MELNEFLKRKKGTLFSIFLIFFIIGSVYTFVQPFKYSAKSKLLVIQEGASGVDPFAVSRSVEYLSSLFSEVAYSNSFFNLVLDSNFNIERDYFKGDSIKQMKIWRQTISAKNVEDSGFIFITIYHPSSYQAKQIAMAVNNVLMTQNINYQGIGSSVKINIIDEPVVSNYPAQPNLLVNFALIVLGSLIFGFIYIYLFPEDKYNIHLWGNSKKGHHKTQSLQHDFLNAAKPASYQPREEAEDWQNRGNIKNVL